MNKLLDIVFYVYSALVILVLGLGLVYVVFYIGGSIMAIVMPDCPTEDSVNCYWDGGENGLGDRYLVLNDGTVRIELN